MLAVSAVVAAAVVASAVAVMVAVRDAIASGWKCASLYRSLDWGLCFQRTEERCELQCRHWDQLSMLSGNKGARDTWPLIGRELGLGA